MSAPTAGARQALTAAIDHLRGRPLVVCTDFDGTLSQIVLDPWAAAIVPLARAALRRLAAIDGVEVVVLSGRTSTDVAARVRVGNVTYLGNHGMERSYLARGGRPEKLETTVVGASAEAAAMAAKLADEVGQRIGQPWLVVERKPPTVAFHYRQAEDVAAAGRLVRAAVDELDPDGQLERFPGRRVLELRPLGAIAKGGAVESLIRQRRPKSMLMLGDDVSDALGFAVLRAERESERLDGVAVAIQARSEVPPEVTAAADIVLGSPAEAAKFLSALARSLDGAPALT